MGIAWSVRDSLTWAYDFCRVSLFWVTNRRHSLSSALCRSSLFQASTLGIKDLVRKLVGIDFVVTIAILEWCDDWHKFNVRTSIFVCWGCLDLSSTAWSMDSREAKPFSCMCHSRVISFGCAVYQAARDAMQNSRALDGARLALSRTNGSSSSQGSTPAPPASNQDRSGSNDTLADQTADWHCLKIYHPTSWADEAHHNCNGAVLFIVSITLIGRERMSHTHPGIWKYVLTWSHITTQEKCYSEGAVVL